MARSMSGPPVFSPSGGADALGSWVPARAREFHPPMARLSKLGLRNYASPGRSRASSVDENDKPSEHAHAEEEDIVQQARPPVPTVQILAPSPSPASSAQPSPDDGSADSSAASSATSSPLPSPPHMLSFESFDSLPKLANMWQRAPGRGSGSSGGSFDAMLFTPHFAVASLAFLRSLDPLVLSYLYHTSTHHVTCSYGYGIPVFTKSAAWHARGPPDVGVSVRVSSSTIHRAPLP
jgi:hypothetical protein